MILRHQFDVKMTFFYQNLLSQTLAIHYTCGEVRKLSLLLSAISTRSRTFRNLFSTVHVRRLWRIFNRIAFHYQVVA